jgi:hypothetical protein
VQGNVRVDDRLGGFHAAGAARRDDVARAGEPRCEGGVELRETCLLGRVVARERAQVGDLRAEGREPVLVRPQVGVAAADDEATLAVLDVDQRSARGRDAGDGFLGAAHPIGRLDVLPRCPPRCPPEREDADNGQDKAGERHSLGMRLGCGGLGSHDVWAGPDEYAMGHHRNRVTPV